MALPSEQVFPHSSPSYSSVAALAVNAHSITRSAMPERQVPSPGRGTSSMYGACHSASGYNRPAPGVHVLAFLPPSRLTVHFDHSPFLFSRLFSSFCLNGPHIPWRFFVSPFGLPCTTNQAQAVEYFFVPCLGSVAGGHITCITLSYCYSVHDPVYIILAS